MARQRNMLGRHFIEWYIEDILAAVERLPARVFVVHKVDFHDPLESIVLQYCEWPEVLEDD